MDKKSKQDIPSLELLKKWENQDREDVIIEKLEQLPENELDYDRMNILAKAYSNTGAYGKAIPYLQRFEKRGKDDPLWNWRMGLCLFETGKPIDAIPYLERAIELGDDWQETKDYLARARQTLNTGSHLSIDKWWDDLIGCTDDSWCLLDYFRDCYPNPATLGYILESLHLDTLIQDGMLSGGNAWYSISKDSTADFDMPINVVMDLSAIVVECIHNGSVSLSALAADSIDDVPDARITIELDRESVALLKSGLDAFISTPASFELWEFTRERDREELLAHCREISSELADYLGAGGTIQNVPWHRLATTYGRATDFPRYFDALLGADKAEADRAGKQLALNIEHQSTLWPATPFAVKVLVEILEQACKDIGQDTKRFIALNLVDLFIEIAEACAMADSMEHADPLPHFEDMLKEEYLWSDEYDEEEDEARYEEDGGPFAEDLFYSFYHYTREALGAVRAIANSFSFEGDDEINSKLVQLISLIGESASPQKVTIAQIDEWHEQDRHAEIVKALQALPFAERNFELMSLWARALNNLNRYDEAIEILSSVADEGKDDALWNYRLGYALYFGRHDFEEAVRYLERATSLGDTHPATTALLNAARQNAQSSQNLQEDASWRRLSAARPTTLAAWREAYLSANLDHLWAAIEPHAKSAISLVREAADDGDIPVGTTKFGGSPDLSPGVPWPERDGIPLAFLAQINFAETAPYDTDVILPKSGLLYLFYDVENEPWGYDPKDKDGHRVIYCPGDSSGLERIAPPESLSPDFIFPVARISFEQTLEFPSYFSSYCEDVELTDEQATGYYSISDLADLGYMSKLLGHSDNIQGAMELECQLASNGIYLGDGFGYKDSRAKSLKADMLDWILLLQIDSSDDCMWGDDGRLYLWIRKQDLAAQDFSKTWVILQCY